MVVRPHTPAHSRCFLAAGSARRVGKARREEERGDVGGFRKHLFGKYLRAFNQVVTSIPHTRTSFSGRPSTPH